MDQSCITMEIESPFGPLSATQANEHLVALNWTSPERSQTTPLLKETARQLAAYFNGTLKDFDLPLLPGGNEFQKAVCQAIFAIPFGETSTYGEIAQKLDTYGQPVGNACGMNTIPIIIPCHRVLAANGLGGYSGDGGVERKIKLLKHEGAFPYLL